MKTAISELLRYIGIGVPREAHADKGAPDSELFLYLPLKPTRIRVGSLRKEGEEFVFQYDPEFAASDLPPLPDFPDKTRPYRSPDLWAFFLVRLPPVDRPDVAEVIQSQGIQPNDIIELLGKLSRRVVSSPYELELRHAS